SVTYQAVLLQQLQLTDIVPATGAAIMTESTTISGKVHASSAIEEVNVYINEFSVVLTATNQPDVYGFTKPDIALQLGENNFVIRAETALGSAEQMVTLVRTADPEKIKDPAISLISPLNNAYLSEASFKLAGRVSSEGGAVSVLVEGEPATVKALATGDYYFEKQLSFPANHQHWNLVIKARDQLNKESEVLVSFYLDTEAPQLELIGIEP